MKKIDYDLAMKAFFAWAIVLRLVLFWKNPPGNAFDDHFEPILLIIKNAALPAKLACWQCYQPPVFYVISAALLKFLLMIGKTTSESLKSLQFLNCLYGIVTIPFLYLILKKLPLSDFSRLLAFGTLCFLPRHIYMSALNSNDTLSYLMVSVCVYLLLLLLEGKHSLPYLFSLSIAICVTIFTKYTTFVVIPMVGITIVLMALPPFSLNLRKALGKAIIVLFLPLVLLAGTMVENKKIYGISLPHNITLFNPAADRPRDPGGADFTSFKPWLFVEKPILWPGQVSSFWTLLYSSMWFDTEPVFLARLEADKRFWQEYFKWLYGKAPAPPPYNEGNRSIRLEGSILMMLGLAPLIAGLRGIFGFIGKVRNAAVTKDWREVVQMQLFVVLLVLNLAGIVLLVNKMPVYCSMKASYLLNSLPAFGLFIALGIMSWEKHRIFRIVCGIFFVVLFLLIAVNILQIAHLTPH